MKYIGSGCGRIVFENPNNPDYVIKIPYNTCGVRQNQEEYELFTNHNDDNVYAECYLYENNVLIMERLEDCSVQFTRFCNGDTFKCTKFDDSIEQIIDLSSCKPNCYNCEHKQEYLFTNEEKYLILKNKKKDRLQVGYSKKDGKVKFFDYAVSLLDTDKINILFNKSNIKLFEEYYIEHPCLDILFSDWLKDKELPLLIRSGNNLELLKQCNYYKRLMKHSLKKVI